MNNEDKRSLWTDSTKSHYFLIPDNEELPSGDFTLCKLNGEEKNVDSTAITSFKLAESEAKAHLQAEMNQAMEQAKTAFSNLMAFSTQTSEEARSNPTPSSDQTESAQNFISALLGVSPEEFQNNPETARTAFLNFYTELKELLGESTSQNPDQVESARARVRSLREKLQAQGINVSEEMEELPDKLREAVSSSKIEGYLQEIVAKLQDLADQINQSPDAVGQKIDETIKSLSNDLFIDEEKRLEEKRRQQYRQSAQDAIGESFRSLGLPSFAGGDLKLENRQQEEDEKK